MRDPITRAIDLGYGNVKYTKRGERHPIEFAEFPALAVHAHSGALNVQTVQLANTDTITVSIDGRAYQVGPDSPVLLQGLAERVLEAAYARSDRYAALMKGALAYVDESVIDQLVLGLPVSTFAREHRYVEKKWTGGHMIPGRHRCDEERNVEIDRVTVVAQPIGAYMAALGDGLLSREKGNALVIDLGYFTIDWVRPDTQFSTGWA
jgi:plasmid segregation protein ParM